MLKYYQMPNYWMWKVFVCVSDEDVSSISECFLKSEGIDVSSVMEDPPCCVVDTDSQSAIIVLKDWSDDSMHTGVLAHELVHLIIAIGETSRLRYRLAYK